MKTWPERNPASQPREDYGVIMHRDKPHKDWYNRPAMGGRLGDSRGHMAHGKAKSKTSWGVDKISSHS